MRGPLKVRLWLDPVVARRDLPDLRMRVPYSFDYVRNWVIWKLGLVGFSRSMRSENE